MNTTGLMIKSACVAVVACVANLAMADTPASEPKGEAMIASVDVTATVAKVDQKTREVTLRGQDGKEYSFVAGEEVKNLPQLKAGDVVKATYSEALAYEVKKGGKAMHPTTEVVGGSAEPGQKPAAGIAQKTTVTVAITAIDPKVPSVTFTGPKGNSRTIKVQRPEKLEGVKVGDTVEITYAEALAIKVEEVPAK